jgi:putative hydrolase of the HAD superfamily
MVCEAIRDVSSLVLDFGNVITLPPDEGAFDRMAEILTGGDRRAAEFRAAYAASRSEYDRGALSAHEYWRLVGQALGRAPSAAETGELRILDVEAWFRFDPAMVEWFSAIRSSVRHLALLSNINDDGVDALRRMAPWLGTFDTLVLSCEHKVVKPGAAIFGILVDRLDVEPGECLFVDDIEANVEGARAAGLNAHRYGGLDGLRAELGERYRLVR